jgi:hypothetical protein
MVIGENLSRPNLSTSNNLRKSIGNNLILINGDGIKVINNIF